MHPSHHALSDTEGALDIQKAIAWVVEHCPTIAVRVPLRVCPLSTYAAHAEKALYRLYRLRAFWSPSCHHELPTSLQAASAASTESQCQKQQTGNALLRQNDRRRRLWCFFKGQKNLSFVRTGWENRAVLMTTFGYLQPQDFIKQVRNTLPNTRKTEATLSPLGTTPSLLHAIWNKRENEPNCSQQCHRWGCSHKATIKLTGQRSTSDG